MAKVVPEYHDVTDGVVHHSSTQHHVASNHDLALDLSHEHHHSHLHHDASAEQGREDELVYSKDTTFEKSTIPYQAPQDHSMHQRRQPNQDPDSVEIIDAEKGAMSSPPLEAEDPQSHRISGLYARYRIFFHLFLWLFFTGYVIA